MASQTLYEILGVLEDASPDEIKAAYRRKMRYLHPDRGGSEEAATQVNAAYDVLSDAGRRAKYDRSRQRGVAHCPLCDDRVHSEGELVEHLVRHRAEVEAAQAVVAREDARRAQKSSQRAGSTGGDQGTDGRQPSTVVSGSRGSEPRRSLSTSSASAWLILLAALAFIAAMILVPIALDQSSSDVSPQAEPLASQESTATTVGRSVTSLGSSSTTVQQATTTKRPASGIGAIWDLPPSLGRITREGSVDAPWSQSSEPWEQYFANEVLFTVDGDEGHRKIFDGCIDELCDYWLLGLENGNSQQAWQVMGYLWSTQVLRFDQLEIRDVALCWSATYDAPVVVSADVGSSGAINAIDSAWVLPSWYGDGLWMGLDVALIDTSNVAALPLNDGFMPTC